MASQGVGNQNQKAKNAIGQHVSEQQGHAEDTAKYGGHGHMFGGHQTGSAMPPSDAAKQKNAKVPQGGSNDCEGDEGM